MSGLYYKNTIGIIRDHAGSDFEMWGKFYKFFNLAIDLVDRTRQFKFPVMDKIYSQCELPVLSTTNLSYNDCCNNRANEIWQLSKSLNKPIGIFWSGGIDSTRVLVSFLSNFSISELKDRVRIICSEYSAQENPVFYKKYVLPNFQLINSESSPWLFDSKLILVTGETNDELFGTHRLKNYLLLDVERYKQKFNKQSLFEYVNNKIDDPTVSWLLINAVSDSAEVYGITLDTDSDWFWWSNFCFNWQNNYLRSMTLAAPELWPTINEEYMKTYVHHFFSTHDFQLWSINSPEIRVIEKWTDYKLQAKKEIFEFDGDRNYFETKTKRGSFTTVFRHRTLAEAIGPEFQIIGKFDVDNWHNLDNDFAKTYRQYS